MIMTDNALNPAIKEAKKASSSASSALEHAERSFDEAKISLTEAAKRVEQSLLDGFDTLRAQSRTYSDTAGQQLEEAQRYVSERVKERPITATLAGLGVGLLVGLLLAGGSRSHNK